MNILMKLSTCIYVKKVKVVLGISRVYVCVCVCVYVTLWCQFKEVGDRVKESVKKAMEYFDPEFFDYEVILLVIIVC